MSTKAKRFLLELQANAATDRNSGSGRRPNLSRAALILAIQDTVESGRVPAEGAILRHLQDAAVELGCGPLEDICAYAVLMRNVRRIEASVKEVYDRNLDPLPTFGTLPQGDMNARALRVPETSEDFVVVLQQGLFDFLFSVTETFAAILPFGDSGSLILPLDKAGNNVDKKFLRELVHKRIKEMILQQEHDKTLLHFLEAVTTYLSLGNLDATTIWWGREHLQFKSFLVKSSIRFVVAHELGHIYKGHLWSAERKVLALNGQDVEYAAPDWNAEYAADLEGFWLGEADQLASRSREVRAAGATWGAELFFCACELVEWAYSVLEFGEDGHRLSNSHPPPHLRRKTLRSNIGSIAMEAEHRNDTTVGRLFAPGVLLEILSTELWKTVEDLFMNLHEAGYRPAPIWRGSA